MIEPPLASPLEYALQEVKLERERQLRLKQEGRFDYTPSDDGITDFERYGMIGEEFGEVARNCLARAGIVRDGDRTDQALRKELCQVAALSVAWMERL